MRKAICLAVVLVTAGGCSLHRLAVNQLGTAIASGGITFSSDEDPQLVGDALPFSLKLMESLLAETPDHQPLLVACSRGFTQYAYGWVEPEDADGARTRSKLLYLRARDYGLRALSTSIDNFRVRMAAGPVSALKLARTRDVAALYWTAAAWGLAISSAKDDLDLLADLSTVEALILRAAELDPDFENGAIDTFLITFEASRSAVSRDAAASARAHLKLAIERSGGASASPFVAAAEALAIPDQNRAEFDELLARALAVDPNLKPEWRLQNLLAQRRARWLLAHRDDFFIEGSTETSQ